MVGWVCGRSVSQQGHTLPNRTPLKNIQWTTSKNKTVENLVAELYLGSLGHPCLAIEVRMRCWVAATGPLCCLVVLKRMATSPSTKFSLNIWPTWCCGVEALLRPKVLRTVAARAIPGTPPTLCSTHTNCSIRAGMADWPMRRHDTSHTVHKTSEMVVEAKTRRNQWCKNNKHLLLCAPNKHWSMRLRYCRGDRRKGTKMHVRNPSRLTNAPQLNTPMQAQNTATCWANILYDLLGTTIC